MIQVRVERDGDRLAVRVRDETPLFDPTRHPLPDVTLPLEERRLGGLGIFLIRQVMDEVVLPRHAGGRQ